MNERAEVDAARVLLTRAIDHKTFPAAVAEVGDSERILWREAFGRLTFDADAPAASLATIFDLASLTKPLATTTVVLQLASAGVIDLQQPLSECFAEWRGTDREGATVRDLLEHASGLAARLVDSPPSAAGNSNTISARCPSSTRSAVNRSTAISDSSFSDFSLRIAAPRLSDTLFGRCRIGWARRSVRADTTAAGRVSRVRGADCAPRPDRPDARAR